MAADRRKVELEAKRAKLAELKRVREERKAHLASAAFPRPETPADPPPSRAQLDDYISTLLQTQSPRAATPASTRADDSQITPTHTPKSGRTSSVADASHSPGQLPSQSPILSQTESTASQTTEDPVSLAETVKAEEQPPPPKPKVITYDKSVQTTNLFSLTASPDDAFDNVGRESESELRARLLKEFEAERARLDAEIKEEQRKLEQEQEEARRKGLDPSTLSSILASGDFHVFLEHSTKITQRALADTYDYLKDYSIPTGAADFQDDDNDCKKIKCTHTFSDSRWTKNRSVSALDWSPKYPELVVAAYTKNPETTSDPDGIVCVWNLHLLDRPEYVFHSQSDVLSVMFAPFSPNIVIGGTYSGQILVWDTRARALPVLKSPLSAAGHTHPVYSLALPGTQNAHNLVSASTDGTVCAWVLDMLAKPVETLELTHPGYAKTDEVSITCMGFPHNDPSAFWVGTEEGNVYTANRYDRAGHKAGLVQNEVYRGHAAPVLGLDFHPPHGPIDFGDLFLTCGTDWTVKLWRTRGRQQQTAATAGAQQQQQKQTASSTVAPLHVFEEAEDYVFDVRWHPSHPAMFGSVDGSGKFNLWNLNVDTEIPMVSSVVNPSNPKALNKLAWEKREGKKAAIGSTDGVIYIYDIGDLGRPRDSEWDLAQVFPSALDTLRDRLTFEGTC